MRTYLSPSLTPLWKHDLKCTPHPVIQVIRLPCIRSKGPQPEARERAVPWHWSQGESTGLLASVHFRAKVSSSIYNVEIITTALPCRVFVRNKSGNLCDSVFTSTKKIQCSMSAVSWKPEHFVQCSGHADDKKVSLSAALIMYPTCPAGSSGSCDTTDKLKRGGCLKDLGFTGFPRRSSGTVRNRQADLFMSLLAIDWFL